MRGLASGTRVPATNNGLNHSERLEEYEDRIQDSVVPMICSWIVERQREGCFWIVCLQEAPPYPGMFQSLVTSISNCVPERFLRHAMLRKTAHAASVTMWDSRFWHLSFHAHATYALCTVLTPAHEGSFTRLRLMNCHFPHDGSAGASSVQPDVLVRELLDGAPIGQLVLLVGDLNADVHGITSSLALKGFNGALTVASVHGSATYDGRELTTDAALLSMGRAKWEGLLSLDISREVHPLNGLDRDQFINQNIHRNLQARKTDLDQLSLEDLGDLGSYHFADQPAKLALLLRSSQRTHSMFGRGGRSAFIERCVHRKLQTEAATLDDKELWLLGQVHFSAQFSEMKRAQSTSQHVSVQPEGGEHGVDWGAPPPASDVWSQEGCLSLSENMSAPQDRSSQSGGSSVQPS